MKSLIVADAIPWTQSDRDVLVLNYTMACPLACDFCCYGCHPKRAETMPLANALALVHEAAQIESISSVGFTGGEMFLHLDDFYAIGEELRKLQLPFTVATAAHWGTTFDEANRILDRLAALGLKRLNVSYDPSHEKFVPLRSVLNAVRAASSLGIETHVVGTFYDETAVPGSYLEQLRGLDNVSVHTKVVAKVGRATKAEVVYEAQPKLSEFTCYRRVNFDVVVFYDGKVYPCCSTFNRATPGLVLGNAFEEGLTPIVRRLHGSLLYRTIKRQDFGELYEIVRERDPALYSMLPQASGSAGPCSHCNRVFRDPAIAKRIGSIVEEYDREMVNKALDALFTQFGEETTNQLATTILGI